VPKLAIAKVHTSDGSNDLGTAFAVSQFLAITAFHCLKDNKSQQPLSRIRLNWHGGTDKTYARFATGDLGLDYALLELEESIGDEFVPLSSAESAEIGGPFRSFGFPASVSDVDMTCITGTIASSECTIFEGVPAIQLYCKESAAGLQLGGMSGAPVLAGQPEKAVGLIRWNPPSEEDPSKGIAGMVYATPLAVIRGRHPAFFPERRKEQSADEQWQTYIKYILLYADDFDCNGRKNFFIGDILANYYDALTEYSKTGDLKYEISVIVSNLPLISGTNDLDEDRLKRLIDYCVAKTYLKRKPGGRIFYDSFEITDAGRLYLAELEMKRKG
jgi:Trypsin-like peptidase domain